MSTLIRACVLLVLGSFLATSGSHADEPDVDPVKVAGLHGGLIVQLGASDVTTAAALSIT